ncbi:hypothetical protein P3T73_06400 [Kiritimatiellota bacterium B12222]|nr:hypothetical protein P3T73_06400 [Kiritimatiellota bacterium B12222]
MSGRFPVGKPKLPAWSLSMMALLLAFMVHALWVVIPQPHLHRETVVPKGKLYAYPNLDTQRWSPTLFSLPSPLGFSGAIRQREPNVLPPLKSSLILHSPSVVNLDDFFETPGLDIPLSPVSHLPITVYSEAKVLPQPVLSFSWRLTILDGDDLDYEMVRLPGPPQSARAVVLHGTMTFDASGQVSSLILDPPLLPQETRSAVLRSLRRVRRLKGEGETRIRFRFAYEPEPEGKG